VVARITGIGGVFFRSPDPKALAAWYRDKLGLTVEDWGGAMIQAEGAGPGYGVWSPFKQDTDQQMDGMGKFAWILDPDGTKIELWQPE
jgi:catechol 2,3-dioxygenase-like lactoylglutathione lyase family enzyme